MRTLYKRFEEKGRILPEALSYINSWINEELIICYQLMETGTEKKLREWISSWHGLADFEVIPVIGSAAAKQKVFEEDL